jgi:hypothetical protein
MPPAIAATGVADFFGSGEGRVEGLLVDLDDVVVEEERVAEVPAEVLGPGVSSNLYSSQNE